MRLRLRGFTGGLSDKFVRFECLEEILFDEGTAISDNEELEQFAERSA